MLILAPCGFGASLGEQAVARAFHRAGTSRPPWFSRAETQYRDVAKLGPPERRRHYVANAGHWLNCRWEEHAVRRSSGCRGAAGRLAGGTGGGGRAATRAGAARRPGGGCDRGAAGAKCGG